MTARPCATPLLPSGASFLPPPDATSGDAAYNATRATPVGRLPSAGAFQFTGEVATLAARVEKHLKKMGAVWK